MADTPDRKPRLSSSALQEIDRRCDAFEAALRAGQRPLLEEYLTGLSGPENSVLLRELRALEDAYRAEAATGAPPSDSPQGGEALSSPDEGAWSLGPVGLPCRFGDYELLEKLGQGGMGEVFRARQLSAQREVALKIIRRDRLAELPAARQREYIDRFKTEALAAAHIEHENVVPIYHVGEIEGRHFYSMRYIRGRNLAEYLQETPLEPRRAAEIVDTVARAVHHAHERGILHRDLKPRNLILDSEGRPYVADFGLAKWVLGGLDATASGALLGSPPYMAPEQVRDASSVTALADVYSLGATLYHLLAGRPPFNAGNLPELLHQVLNNDPLPLAKLQPGINRDLETICLKCLEKEPARRYASALLLADDLKRFLQGEPIVARRAGAIERLGKWVRRHPSRAALGAVSLTLAATLAVAGLAYVVKLKQDRDTANRERDLDKEAQALQDQVNRGLEEVVDDLQYDWADHIPEMGRSAGQDWGRKLKTLEERLSAKSLVNPKIALSLARLRRLKADTEMMAGRLPEAQAGYLAALEAFDRAPSNSAEVRRDRAACLHNLGVLHYKRLAYKEAETELLKALDLRRELARADHSPEFRRELAVTHYYLGALYARMPERRPEAPGKYREALALQETLVEEKRENLLYRMDLARTLNNQGIYLRTSGDLPGARKVYERALKLQEQIVAERPSAVVTFARRYLARTQYNRAEVLAALGKNEDAEEGYRLAITNFERIHTFFPQIPEYGQELAAAYLGMAGHLDATLPLSDFDTERIQAGYEKAVQLRQALAPGNESPAVDRQKLALARRSYGHFLLSRYRVTDAEHQFLPALEVMKSLVKQHPMVADYRDDEATLLNSLAVVARLRAADKRRAAAVVACPSLTPLYLIERNHSLRAALVRLTDATRIHRELAEQNPDNVFYRKNLGLDHLETATIHADLAEHEQALKAAQLFRESVRQSDNQEALIDAAARWCPYATWFGVAGEGYRREALECLRQARQHGWKRLEALDEKRFDPLRNDAAFKKLLLDGGQ